MYRGPLLLLPAAEECDKVKIVLEYPVPSVHLKVAVHARAVTYELTDLVFTGKTPQ